MKNRSHLLLWALLAMATFALGSVAATPALAQADSCCIRVNNNTSICHVDLCVLTANGAFRCLTVYANTSDGFRFLCPDTILVIITDACGIQHRLHVGDCVRVQLRSGCCAQACLRLAHDGCYQLDVDEIAGPCQC